MAAQEKEQGRVSTERCVIQNTSMVCELYSMGLGKGVSSDGFQSGKAKEGGGLRGPSPRRGGDRAERQ